MPRPIRLQSETGIYHVMSRGNRRRVIFHDNEDKKRFINILLHKKQDNSFSLFAYCIMDNHYHLLIKEEKENLPTIMKMINSTYATYYNFRYEGMGHVFQDRYRSEAVHNDAYLFGVTRYIHNNPRKAGMVNGCKDYPWSSYQQYIYYKKDNKLLDVSYILNLLSEDRNKAVNRLITFTDEENTDSFIDDFDEKEEIEKIKEYMELALSKAKVGKDEIINDKKYLNVRNDIIRSIKEKSPLSPSKIAEIIGISRNLIYKIK